MTQIVKIGNSVAPYTAVAIDQYKCHSALQAVQSGQPSIGNINREYGFLRLVQGVGTIAEKLFKVKYSKIPLSPELLDEFAKWVLADYYYLNLPEIELALMGYDGETYHIIDLDVLKKMVRTYDTGERESALLERAKAKEEAPKPLPGQLFLGSPEKRGPPEKFFDEVSHKLAVSMLAKREARPVAKELPTLEGLFSLWSKDPDGTAKGVRAQWEEEWDNISKSMEVQGLGEHTEPKQLYISRKERIFITQLTATIKK